MEKALTMMVEHVPMGMVLFSEDGTVLARNQAALTLLKRNGRLAHIRELSDAVQEAFFACRSTSLQTLQDGSLRIFLQAFQESGCKYVMATIFDDPDYYELQRIVHESFDEILVTDGNGVITKISARCEELYGLSAHELIGKRTSDLAAQGVFTPTLTPMVLREKRKVSAIQYTRTGKKLYVIGNPIFDEDGQIYRIVFNSRETSEIEALEKRLQETEDLLDRYRNELNQLKQLVTEERELVYRSKEMEQVFQLAAKVAQVDSTVLITGETGVGKGMMARFIHRQSGRGNNKLIEINCGAIPENLIESELFGYESGAFTGANREGKKGVVELAENGTLFLDEIGELPLNVQVKLLQFLQDGTFRRVGGNRLIQVNTRIIAATNQDLRTLVKEKKFREDLYFRLNVVPIMIPPLRHRKEDIPALADSFLARLNLKYQTNKKLSAEVYERLMEYEWPGNVRELENLIERLVVTSDANTITPDDLPDYLRRGEDTAPGIVVKEICPLKKAVEDVEKQLITLAYQTYKNTYKCAEVLQVNQSTVVRKLKKYS